jgi:hypothetical protein
VATWFWSARTCLRHLSSQCASNGNYRVPSVLLFSMPVIAPPTLVPPLRCQPVPSSPSHCRSANYCPPLPPVALCLSLIGPWSELRNNTLPLPSFSSHGWNFESHRWGRARWMGMAHGEAPADNLPPKMLKGDLNLVVSLVRWLIFLSNLVNLQRRCLVSCRQQHMTAPVFCEGTTNSMGWLDSSRSKKNICSLAANWVCNPLTSFRIRSTLWYQNKGSRRQEVGLI